MWLITTSIVVVFVIFVIFSGVYKMVTDNEEIPWPPHISRCPSYWQEDNNTCKPNDMYKINTGIASDPTEAYDGTNILSCKKFADDNSVFWDGISQ